MGRVDNLKLSQCMERYYEDMCLSDAAKCGIIKIIEKGPKGNKFVVAASISARVIQELFLSSEKPWEKGWSIDTESFEIAQRTVFKTTLRDENGKVICSGMAGQEAEEEFQAEKGETRSWLRMMENFSPAYRSRLPLTKYELTSLRSVVENKTFRSESTAQKAEPTLPQYSKNEAGEFALRPVGEWEQRNIHDDWLPETLKGKKIQYCVAATDHKIGFTNSAGRWNTLRQYMAYAWTHPLQKLAHDALALKYPSK